jgi:hypothetical protein
MSVRVVVAALVGVITALVLVVGIEAVGHRLYPTPAGIDLSDPDQLRRYVDGLPVGAFLIVLASWVVATFVGGLVAAMVATSHPHLLAGSIGVVILLATFANLVVVPHPTWFSVLAMVTVPVAAWASGVLAARWGRR